MAYSKQKFRDGQTVYSAQLEKMENGIIEAQIAAKNANTSIGKMNVRLSALEEADYSGVDGMIVVDGMLYLTQNGEIVSEGVVLPAGGSGSGGGSTNNAVMTLTNTAGWLAKTVALGGACSVSVRWSSVENKIATGKGILTVTVGTAVKLTKEVAQGSVTIDLCDYLTAGSNSVKVAIADVYGNVRTVFYTVNVVAVSISSTFNASVAYTDEIIFPYTPVGAVDKNVYFELDGSVIGTATVASSGREQYFTIPMQGHGSHELRVWFEADVEGETVVSNVLHYSLICVETGYITPIIACAYDQAEAKQYETLLIPYIVYNPASLTSAVEFYANNEKVASLTVDRTEQVWNYRLMDAGKVKLKIVCGSTTWEHTIDVSAVQIDVKAETSGLELHLTSAGRSNNEDAQATWENNGISAVFTGFNFASDGWQIDEEGNTALRVTGDARLEIPLKLFEKDFSATGKTIEIEFATRNVLNYDAVILSCMNEGRGIEITSQRANMTSEQSAIGTQYKEEEHVRLSFVVEKTGGNRFIYCYINGILSGVKQYPTGDDFSQASPVTIAIGSNDCTIDLYNIRVYGNALNRYQILDNWIADTQDVTQMIERYERNSIYDAYDQIIKENLPKDLPYMVVVCPVLPSFKGDKKTCSGTYVDPVHPEKSFTFKGAEIDVQGTSSQYYYVKNFKIKFKGGFILTDGTNVELYQLNDDVIPTGTYTFKADVASSEGANNVVLAELYNELCPVKTPPQEADPRVRQTIDGHPIVMFWDNGDGNPVFAGKYNFNHDKGTEEVFGFNDGDESWEIKQNGTDRVGFRSADFSEGSGWEDDFEARYPEDNTDTTNLAAFSAWLVSTDPDQATGNSLGAAVTHDSVTYTADTAEYRLAKFRAELPEHASVDALVFYYVFTEIFLCIDQREKNAFPTLFDALKLWLVLFYDADSSLGTDNKGNLAFDYYLEDIDFTEAGEPVYNGQNSVLWANLRKTYYSEIEAEYKRLRTTNRTDGSGNALLSYDVANSYFENHQNKWPEAIFNEDGFKKSIEPMVLKGDGLYLPMLQGKKEQHRKWWLYNRFRYLDSKYNTGTSMTNRITIRAHAKANVSLTAYVNMYGHVFYNSEQVEHRMVRGTEYEFVWAASGAEDAVIGINDADMLTNLGDLSPLLPELVDISKATHLTALKVGDSASTYSNGNLKTLTLGNNVLLTSLDVRNCPSFADAVDASGCTNIEEVYLDGTAITGLSLPNGGMVKTLHLPGTIANLTLLNQNKITDFVLPSYSQITTLRLENVADVIDSAAILAAMPENSRVRLIGIDWTMEDADEVLALYDHLDKMRGMDEGGNTLNTAQVSGVIRIDSLTGAELAAIQSRYPYITIEYAHITSNCFFYNHDGTLLYTATCADGADAVYAGNTPEREEADGYMYDFAGWSKENDNTVDDDALSAVLADRNVYAAYNATPVFYVRYYSNDGSTLLYTDKLIGGGQNSTYGGSTPTKASTAQYTFTFSGWSLTAGGSANANALLDVTADRNLYAAFTETIRTYTVYFYNGTTLLQTVSNVQYGSTAKYTGSTPAYTGSGDAADYEFAGFSPSGAGITGNTSCYAQFRYTGYVYTQVIDGSLVEYSSDTLATVGEYAFYKATSLTKAELAAVTSIETYAFNGCSALTMLILRNTDAVVTLGSNALANSAIANGTGYVYVPAALLEDYKAATNWSAYANQIRAIEEYPEVWPLYDWNAVAYHIEQGDYADVYAIGDLIPLDLGSEGAINMQIAAFDADDKADGSGKAPISWISKELLATSHRMNPKLVTNDDGTYQEGTGTIGGWEKCEMRTYLNDTIKPLIPAEVRNKIVSVTKTQTAYNTAGASFSQTTEDDVWIPGYAECYDYGIYKGVFTNNASRIKYKAGASSSSMWWLRNSASANMFKTSNGYSRSSESIASNGVALGFCM